MAHLFRLIAHASAWVFACWWLLQPLHALAQTVYYNYHAAINPLASQPRFDNALTACTAYGGASIVESGGVLNCKAANGSQMHIVNKTPVTLTCTGSQTAQFVGSGASATWACVEVEPPSACELLSGQTVYLSFNGAVSPGGTSCSTTGCTATVGSPVIRAKTPSGAWVSEADATFTGAECTPSPTVPEGSPDTCPNGQAGEVNGVSVCIPYSSQDEVEQESGSTTETDDGTNNTVTTTSSTTSCTNNSCTTTTTTNVSVNGGTPTTTTTETTEPRDDFCTANPRAPQCRESSFGGSCDSGFTCQGDAVQCAQAQQLHRLACIVTQDSEEAALYGAEKDLSGGPADIPSDTVDVGPGSLEAGNALGVAACIPDLAVTVAGTAITLPLSNICPYLAYLRLMLLAVAWLMAFRIVARD